jgi:uncharacterized membrane protein YjdF
MIEPQTHTSVRAPQIALLVINIALLVGFGIVFAIRRNYEFITYVVVVGGVIAVLVGSMRRVNYTLDTLIAMTVWAALHLAGGGILVGEYERLYALMLIPIPTPGDLPILRYDQFVHMWGFATAALLTQNILVGHLRSPMKGKFAISLVIVMAAAGFGAFNEIVEYLVDSALPESGVGGYINTSLDLCSNMIGAIVGVVYLHLRGRLR